MRVATYTRVGVLDQHPPTNLTRRRSRLHAYVVAQPGWCQVADHDDVGSGRRLDRPGLSELLRGAGTGRFQLLVVDDLNRLSRDKDQLVWLLDALFVVGVGVHPLHAPGSRRGMVALTSAVAASYLWG